MALTPEENETPVDYDRTSVTLAFIRSDLGAMREVLGSLADVVQRLDAKADRIATEVHEVHGKVDALQDAHEQLRTAFDDHTH